MASESEEQARTIQSIAGAHQEAVGNPDLKFTIYLAPTKQEPAERVVQDASLWPRRDERAEPGEVVAYGHLEGQTVWRNFTGKTPIRSYEPQ